MGDSLATLARHDEAVACFLRARRGWASPEVRRISETALSELAPVDDAEAESLLCWKTAVSLERNRQGLRQGAALAPEGGARASA